MSMILSESELDVSLALGDDWELLLIVGSLAVGELGTDGGLVVGS